MTNLKNQTLFKGSGKKNQTYFEDSGTYYKKKFGNVHKKNYMMRGHSGFLRPRFFGKFWVDPRFLANFLISANFGKFSNFRDFRANNGLF